MKQLWPIAALSLSLALPGLTTAEVVTFDPTQGYTSGSDTWVGAHHSSQANPGGPGQNRLDGNIRSRQHGDSWHTYQGLVRFDDIIGTTTGQVTPQSQFGGPSGFLQVQVNNATININATDTTSADVQFYRMTQGWDENTVIYNSFMLDGTRGAQPGSETATPFEDELTAGNADPLKNSSTGGSKELDVTAAVQAWVNGAPNFGFLVSQTNGDEFLFSSFNNTTVANRPFLTVDFTVVPEPASVALWASLAALGGVFYYRRRRQAQ